MLSAIVTIATGFALTVFVALIFTNPAGLAALLGY